MFPGQLLILAEFLHHLDVHSCGCIAPVPRTHAEEPGAQSGLEPDGAREAFCPEGQFQPDLKLPSPNTSAGSPGRTPAPPLREGVRETLLLVAPHTGITGKTGVICLFLLLFLLP